MKYPNLNEEKKLWKRGYRNVIGLDESGRGPLAGPVVAAAVTVLCHCEHRPASRGRGNPGVRAHTLDCFGHCDALAMTERRCHREPRHSGADAAIPSLRASEASAAIQEYAHPLWIAEPVPSGARDLSSPRNDNSKINDSKKLSVKQREELYEKLMNCPAILWGVGAVSEKMIDKINILEATKLAMKKAVLSLRVRRQARKDELAPDFLLIDGNFGLDINIKQKSIIKGDQKVFSISAASIIAKVHRDRLMQKYHKKYPDYGFLQNKGYPTAGHFACLARFGPCKIHRKSFV